MVLSQIVQRAVTITFFTLKFPGHFQFHYVPLYYKGKQLKTLQCITHFLACLQRSLVTALQGNGPYTVVGSSEGRSPTLAFQIA
jgi:hypothetical protein